jgi:hypothetical protein
VTRRENGSCIIRAALVVRRLSFVRPLGIRDFRLLWLGSTISLLGDGLYFVALPWLVYSLSNDPTALSLVGIAWTGPILLTILFGGVLTDRLNRKRVLILSDTMRFAAIGTMGALEIVHVLELWHVCVLVAVYGTASALFNPALTAFVKEVVPQEMLVEANSLDQFMRPLAVRLAGPALGGVGIAIFGTGEVLLLDAASFLALIGMLAIINGRTPLGRGTGNSTKTVVADLRDGLSFVSSRVWLWGTFAALTIAMLFFLGPVYVLMPFVVKNELHGGSDGLGLVYAAGGIGAMTAALVTGQRGLPRRPVTVMYLAWTCAAISLVGYALAGDLWIAMLVSLACIAGITTGQIIWVTLMQRFIPDEFIGRVAALDGFVSFALVPVSYALTGPIASMTGVDTALIASGLLSGAVFVAVLVIVPRIRELEEREPPLVRMAEKPVNLS